jgi:hypothetical protein
MQIADRTRSGPGQTIVRAASACEDPLFSHAARKMGGANGAEGIDFEAGLVIRRAMCGIVAASISGGVDKSAGV